MKLKTSRIALAICALSLAVNGLVFAQEKAKRVEVRRDHQVIIEQEVGPGTPGGAPFEVMVPGAGVHAFGDNTFFFVSSEMSFGGKVVKGAPYSAEGVTETVQTLADGNRIVRKSSVQVYRDSQGRTRHEQTLNAIGPFAAAGEAARTISISDPVAGTSFHLDTRSNTARKITVNGEGGKIVVNGGDVSVAHAMPRRAKPAEGDAAANHDVHVEMRMRHPGPPPGVAAGGIRKSHPLNAKTESLGKQVVEGVEAEGTRTTTTIPAGEIGNEQPINMVFEQWYSPELQVVVMRKSSDPRFGETTYRLTNINRTEPASSLFEVPSNYTINEERVIGPRVVVREKKEN